VSLNNKDRKKILIMIIRVIRMRKWKRFLKILIINMINISKKITEEKKGYLDLKFFIRRKINKVNAHLLSFRITLLET